MTGSDAASRKFNALIKKLRAQHTELAAPPVRPDGAAEDAEQAVHQLVFSTLLWEASTSQAKSALRRLRESVVDYNELRVCIPDEIAAMLGDRYPLAPERAMRLRSLLNQLFNQHHEVTLAPLRDMGKREARHLLDSLEGITPYIAARVCLIENQAHSVPCDERLRDLLVAQGVLPEATSAEEAGGWLERHVKTEECLEIHLLLQAWSDEHGSPPRREARKPEAKAENGEKPLRKAKPKAAREGTKPAKAKPRAGG